MGRDKYPRRSLGSLYPRIKDARVLMVGAGGIGCELLKNLVLTGFGEVHVVDLDTIDLSNLNRQFLFRHEHIKKSKAIVAKQTAAKFNPAIKLEAYHANIKDSEFNIDWFKSFSIVFNALDNLDARRHVNKMCLAADVPLIESGTTGFNGQVQVIKKGRTECYDCNPKETPKTFPVCTIRSTPSQPIHCIVWAKSYLFTEIFGVSEDDAPELDHSEDSENAKEIENLKQESQALKAIRNSIGSVDFERMVFDKVYRDDITRLRSMEDMWKTRKPPSVLSYEDLMRQTDESKETLPSRGDQAPLTLTGSFILFKDSLGRLKERHQKNQKSDKSAVLVFDKDDNDTLDFVTAAANIRSIVFGIEPKSKFDIKQMAGNIIPAIATTNAIVAGLCVLQAFKIMRDTLQNARMVFLTKSTDRFLLADKLRPPNPDCGVCSVTQARVHIDTAQATLEDLVNGFLRTEIGYGEEFSVNNEIGTLYDPELDDNLPTMLKDLGIKQDSFVTVIDEDEENPRVNLILSISEKTLPEESKPVVAIEKFEVARKPPSSSANGHALNGTALPKKRTANEAGLPDRTDEKRTKSLQEAKARDNVLEIPDDDANNGAIIIDD